MPTLTVPKSEIRENTLREIDGIIHLEKYPKGLLFIIARGFGGFKTHP